jgi:hypothetical protein
MTAKPVKPLHCVQKLLPPLQVGNNHYSQLSYCCCLQTDTTADVAQSEASKHIFCFESGSFIIPHPQKAEKGGEDALFITERAIGVADGKCFVFWLF